MSTSAAIARVRPDGYAGVYHRLDGGPASLGRALWKLYRGHFSRDLGRMLAVLIDEAPSGWHTLTTANFARRPAYDVDVPRPSTVPADEHEYARRTLYETPRLQDPNTPWPPITQAHPLDTRWIYAFDADGRTMHVYWMSAPEPGTPLTVIDLEGPEPDWLHIQCGPDLERCNHFAYVHFPEAEDRLAAARDYLHSRAQPPR